MFNEDLKSGTNSELIFWNFYGQLSKYNILTPLRAENEWTEGKDIQTAIISETGLQPATVEIKASLNNCFIKRDNNNSIFGTLEFEIFSNAWDESGKLKPRRQWTTGWLPKILHSDEYKEFMLTNGNKTNVRTPNQFAYMLCKDKLGKQPYACIFFEDFAKLKERLYKIFPFNLDDIVPATHRYDYWINPSLRTPYNCTYIPLVDLIDLAKIVLFEDTPIETSTDTKCPLSIQNARCEFLKNHAAYTINMKTEYEKSQKAGRAFNKDRGLPETAKIPHMTYFDTKKLPSWVKPSDGMPDWVNEYNRLHNVKL